MLCLVPLVGGKFMEVAADVSAIHSDYVEFYDLVWLLKDWPLYGEGFGISIPKCLWDTNYFGTISNMYPHREYEIYFYEAVTQQVYADADFCRNFYE